MNSGGIYPKGAAKALPFFLLLLAGLQFARAQENGLGLPEIRRLDVRDTVYVQYMSDVESSRRQIYLSGSDLENSERIAGELTIYVYTPGSEETILTLSARCNIPYSAIATLNRLSNHGDLAAGVPLLLPSMPGLFIPETPETELERLLDSSRQNRGVTVTVNNGGERLRCRFLPGGDFSATERIFFLNRGFIFPLANFRITSGFGPRQNPVTGNHGVHRGLDLAAPEGTGVHAAQKGTVIEQGEDAVYGKYLIIRHDNNWISLYGHLSKIDTVLNQQVNSATLVGRVGSTGQSTGPHLHFELRQNGTAQDPERLLRLFHQ